MKRGAVVVLFLVVCVGSVAAQMRKPIFRSIDVSTLSKKRSIELGGVLTANADILIKTGNAYVLNGNFGNTERITVYLNDSGKVSRIIFDYGSSKVLKKLIDSYAVDFGKPTIRQSISSAIIKVKVVAWEDRKTRFEIVEREENGEIRISSAMIDKLASPAGNRIAGKTDVKADLNAEFVDRSSPLE